MSNFVYITVPYYESCARMSRTRYKHHRYMAIFPSSVPLQFLGLLTLGTLPNTDKENQFVVLITDRYSNMTRSLPVTITTSPHVNQTFLVN